jgi:2,3-bisphosphoglycerate-dependent phosphoglycerate mutase
MELLLVRHAQPVRVDEGTVAGAADPELSGAGRRQAERLAAWLAADAPAALLSSPLRRARETAAPVAEVLGLPVEVVDGLAEYDAAAGEYIPIEELRAAKDERWYATIEGRWADVGGVDPREFQAQVVPVVESVIARFPGRRVVVFTHGGVLNVYLAHVLGLDAALWFHPEYTSVSRVQAARSGQRSVATLNETAHLYARREPREVSK